MTVIEQNAVETVAGVREYTRTVRRKYQHGPIRVNLIFNEQGEALVNLRGRDFLICIVKPGEGIVKRIAQNHQWRSQR